MYFFWNAQLMFYVRVGGEGVNGGIIFAKAISLCIKV
jgi:hypothetical protein